MFAARPELWQKGVRKIALFAFMATILSLLAPGWSLIQVIGRVESPGTALWRLLPMALLAFLFTAILPTFFFALYRNEGTLQISRKLRFLSLAGAVIFGLFVVAAINTEILDLNFAARGGLLKGSARIISHIISLVPAVGNVALFLLLLMFFLKPPLRDSEEQVPGLSFLDQITKITVVCYGLVVAVCLIRVFLTPYTYSVLTKYWAEQQPLAAAWQNGQGSRNSPACSGKPSVPCCLRGVFSSCHSSCGKANVARTRPRLKSSDSGQGGRSVGDGSLSSPPIRHISH